MGDAAEANLALARRAFELSNTGGIQALVDHVWAPDVVYYEVPEFPDAGVFRGAAAVAARSRELVEALGPFQMAVRSLEGRGDYVLAAFDASVKGTGSGMAMTTPGFHVYRFRGSRVSEYRAYADGDQARREYERLAIQPSR